MWPWERKDEIELILALCISTLLLMNHQINWTGVNLFYFFFVTRPIIDDSFSWPSPITGRCIYSLSIRPVIGGQEIAADAMRLYGELVQNHQ